MNNQDFIKGKVENLKNRYLAFKGSRLQIDMEISEEWVAMPARALQQTYDHAYREGIKEGQRKFTRKVDMTNLNTNK